MGQTFLTLVHTNKTDVGLLIPPQVRKFHVVYHIIFQFFLYGCQYQKYRTPIFWSDRTTVKASKKILYKISP